MSFASQVIPFQKVALYEEHACSFAFTRVGDKDCLCSFSASQGQGNVDLAFVLHLVGIDIMINDGHMFIV